VNVPNPSTGAVVKAPPSPTLSPGARPPSLAPSHGAGPHSLAPSHAAAHASLAPSPPAPPAPSTLSPAPAPAALAPATPGACHPPHPVSPFARRFAVPPFPPGESHLRCARAPSIPPLAVLLTPSWATEWGRGPAAPPALQSAGRVRQGLRASSRTQVFEPNQVFKSRFFSVSKSVIFFFVIYVNKVVLVLLVFFLRKGLFQSSGPTKAEGRGQTLAEGRAA